MSPAAAGYTGCYKFDAHHWDFGNVRDAKFEKDGRFEGSFYCWVKHFLQFLASKIFPKKLKNAIFILFFFEAIIIRMSLIVVSRKQNFVAKI